MATNRIFTNKEGQKIEEVEYHNLVAFNKTADIIAKYVAKGALLYVEGRLQTRSWDDKTTGEKKYRTEIIVENVQLSPKGTGSSARSADDDANDRFEGRSVPTKKANDPMDTIEYPEEDINPDDIPF